VTTCTGQSKALGVRGKDVSGDEEMTAIRTLLVHATGIQSVKPKAKS